MHARLPTHPHATSQPARPPSRARARTPAAAAGAGPHATARSPHTHRLRMRTPRRAHSQQAQRRGVVEQARRHAAQTVMVQVPVVQHGAHHTQTHELKSHEL